MSKPRRTISLSKPDFEESGVERGRSIEGLDSLLPEGVRIRWFRSLIARPMVDGAREGDAVPAGAIVWSEGPGEHPEAAVEIGLPVAEEGPRTLPEAGEVEPATPTVREAVLEALGRLPEGLREGAGAEVERVLVEVGL